MTFAHVYDTPLLLALGVDILDGLFRRESRVKIYRTVKVIYRFGYSVVP